MKTISREEAFRLCIEGEQMTPEERAEVRKKRLKELVSYAREHSAYFKDLYKNLDHNFELSDLPATYKSELMKDYSAWVTDPEVTHEGVFQYLDTPTDTNTLYLDKYTALTTSGTTGNPMPMVRDSYRNTIHGMLMQTRLLRDVDPDLMNPVKNKIATVIFVDPHASSYSSFLRMKKANPEYEQNLLALPVDSSTASIIHALNEFQPDMLTCYPSVMGTLAAAQKDKRLQISPKAIAGSAETMFPNVYHALRDTFQCPVLNNYCSTEGGEAAMSCCSGHLHINDDWIIIEPIDKNGNPVEEGQWSDAILITDLTNYVQPIIRYYMEDKIKISTQPCSCASTLPIMEIAGRVVDNLRLGDVEVLGIKIEHDLQYIEGVYALQLVHKAPTAIELRMIPESEETRQSAFEQTKTILEKIFKENLCPPVEITLSNEPPIHNKRGGKVKRIVKTF